MQISALHTFLAIVDSGSLVRASEQLHVTQSTVTARLKALEFELGQTLLNRQKSGVKLTPAGTKLLRYARIMTGLWRQAQYETALPAGLQSVCTFGCDRELWYGLGRDFLNGVLRHQSEIAVTIRQGSSGELEEWLAAGLVDVILTFDTGIRGSQTAYALPPEELVLYSNRPETPMVGDTHYIYVDHGEDFRRRHGEFYHDAGIARMSFDSCWWALEHLLDQDGSAYLPRALAAPYVQAGRLHLIEAAPVFLRKKHIVVNDTAAQNWRWFEPLIEALSVADLK